MKYKQAKSTDELCLAIFTGVLSGMALGHLCGSLEPEFNPELTESHSLEIGLSVGAAVCAIPIAYHFLKRYALKQQIKSLEKQRDIVSKESSYTKNRNTGLTK